MDTTIIIPCVRRSRFLEKTTLPAIAAHTPSSVPVVIAHEPDLNVSECRQKWMGLAETRYVYFMDVDSVIEQDEWLEMLLDIMDEYQAGAVTAAEHWNGQTVRCDGLFKSQGVVGDGHRVAGAGCLYDKKVGARWDPWLGETYGYIGREFEDVDFAYSVYDQGYKCYSTDRVVFNHAWHDKTDWESDELAMWGLVSNLIKLKWKVPSGLARDNFFRLLHPLPTIKFEKNHNLAGISRQEGIHTIYGDVIEYWGGDPASLPDANECFPLCHQGALLTTPEERGVEDIWSGRYKEVKPRSPQ